MNMPSLDNDKNAAIFAVASICIGALWTLGPEAKDILIPAITGIFAIVTGSRTKE
jgi:hypothetical protein